MQIEIVNIKGEGTGRNLELPDDIFNIEPNDHAIYLDVKAIQAAKRQGNAKVKGRSEVKGSSRKLHRQKGTGGSRKGNIRNPLYKGGGIVHGPQPRDYTMKINKKVKDLARMSALTYKAKENAISIVEDVEVDTPRTKDFLNVLKAMKSENTKVLFVTAGHDKDLYLSSRNLPKVVMAVLSDINTYDILNADKMIMTETAAKFFTDVEATAEA